MTRRSTHLGAMVERVLEGRTYILPVNERAGGYANTCWYLYDPGSASSESRFAWVG